MSGFSFGGGGFGVGRSRTSSPARTRTAGTFGDGSGRTSSSARTGSGFSFGNPYPAGSRAAALAFQPLATPSPSYQPIDPDASQNQSQSMTLTNLSNLSSSSMVTPPSSTSRAIGSVKLQPSPFRTPAAVSRTTGGAIPYSPLPTSEEEALGAQREGLIDDINVLATRTVDTVRRLQNINRTTDPRIRTKIFKSADEIFSGVINNLAELDNMWNNVDMTKEDQEARKTLMTMVNNAYSELESKKKEVGEETMMSRSFQDTVDENNAIYDFLLSEGEEATLDSGLGHKAMGMLSSGNEGSKIETPEMSSISSPRSLINTLAKTETETETETGAGSDDGSGAGAGAETENIASESAAVATEETISDEEFDDDETETMDTSTDSSVSWTTTEDTDGGSGGGGVGGGGGPPPGGAGAGAGGGGAGGAAGGPPGGPPVIPPNLTTDITGIHQQPDTGERPPGDPEGPSGNVPSSANMGDLRKNLTAINKKRGSGAPAGYHGPYDRGTFQLITNLKEKPYYNLTFWKGSRRNPLNPKGKDKARAITNRMRYGYLMHDGITKTWTEIKKRDLPYMRAKKSAGANTPGLGRLRSGSSVEAYIKAALERAGQAGPPYDKSNYPQVHPAPTGAGLPGAPVP